MLFIPDVKLGSFKSYFFLLQLKHKSLSLQRGSLLALKSLYGIKVGSRMV